MLPVKTPSKLPKYMRGYVKETVPRSAKITQGKNPYLRPYKTKKTHLRAGCKRVMILNLFPLVIFL